MNLPLALSNGAHRAHGRPPRLPDGTADRDKWLKAREKARLLRLERRAARRKQHRKRGEKTSRRLRHTYHQIKQLRATATRRAVDWQHKTTTSIARRYGTGVVEKLNIKNMVKSARGTTEEPGQNVAQKAGLNRSISQEAWGRTVTMLTYKTARQGGALRCSACGITTPGSRQGRATFVCKNPDCGWSGNADHNAARNVLHLYRMARALFADFEQLPPGQRNYARWMFLDGRTRTRTRTLFLDWEEQARAAVESPRLEVGRDPRDRATTALVEELRERSPEFDHGWQQHRVHQRTHDSKRLHHPLAGDLTVAYETLTLPGDPDTTLFLYTTEVGSSSKRALDLLASWTLTGSNPEPEQQRHSRSKPAQDH